MTEDTTPTPAAVHTDARTGAPITGPALVLQTTHGQEVHDHGRLMRLFDRVEEFFATLDRDQADEEKAPADDKKDAEK